MQILFWLNLIDTQILGKIIHIKLIVNKVRMNGNGNQINVYTIMGDQNLGWQYV